jgi:hypothetical protein
MSVALQSCFSRLCSIPTPPRSLSKLSLTSLVRPAPAVATNGRVGYRTCNRVRPRVRGNCPRAASTLLHEQWYLVQTIPPKLQANHFTLDIAETVISLYLEEYIMFLSYVTYVSFYLLSTSLFLNGCSMKNQVNSMMKRTVKAMVAVRKRYQGKKSWHTLLRRSRRTGHRSCGWRGLGSSAPARLLSAASLGSPATAGHGGWWHRHGLGSPAVDGIEGYALCPCALSNER